MDKSVQPKTVETSGPERREHRTDERRPEGRSGDPRISSLARLQSVGGNRAVQRLLASRPSGGGVAQRMKDEDGSNRKVLVAMYQKIYKKHNLPPIVYLLKPSDRGLKGAYTEAIASAGSLEEALDRIINFVIAKTDLSRRSKDEQTTWRNKMRASGLSAQAEAASYEQQKKKELEALGKGTKKESGDDKAKGTKLKRRFDEMAGDSDFYKKPENLDILLKKLKHETIRQKILAASQGAYEEQTKHARPSIAKKAELNALEDEEPMGMAEMLSAQKHYKKEELGEALKLEKDDDYQVTMSRRGGQEINQLGPYLPGSHRKSVQETLKELLGDDFTTRDLSRAIETRDSKRTKGKHKLNKKKLGKVRALRHLHAVERARGPEVSIATAMEQRMASLGMKHMDDYILSHPLAPPSATTDIRSARDKAKKKKEDGFAYVPADIQKRAFGSLQSLAEGAFKAPPKEDPSIERILQEIARTEEDPDKENANLAKAFELGMMSPPYVWPEDREHEQEARYMTLWDELLGKADGVSSAGDGSKGDPGKDGGGKDASALGSLPILGLPNIAVGDGTAVVGKDASAKAPLPVTGLPNKAAAKTKGGDAQKSDCFINAVMQVMAGPYADYFDTTKHALKVEGKRAVQSKVFETFQIVKGISPHNADAVRSLRERLHGSGLVEQLVGQEDASELMFKLLRLVTDLEGTVITVPGIPPQPHVMGREETLADVAAAQGCSLAELQTLNVLLDTSPIMMKTQATRTIAASENIPVAAGNSAVYTGGKLANRPDAGPGMQEVGIGDFDSFHEFLFYTFGNGAMKTELDADNRLQVVDDGQPKRVSEYLEQHKMIKIPKVMTFYLKRFKETGDGRVKDNKEFDMPQQFTLVEHSEAGKMYKVYDLVGTAEHAGGVSGGHYTADVAHGDKWYHANDEHVTEQDDIDGDALKNGYIYTYVMSAESADARDNFQEQAPE